MTAATLNAALARDEIAKPSIEQLDADKPKGDDDELIHIKDVDLTALVFQIYGKKKVFADIRDLVLDASFTEAIDETPSFTITLYDPDWELLNSGALETAIDIHVAKRRWYRLDEIDVDDDNITLTFIIRNAVYMMMHNKRRHVSRNKATRAEFVLLLVKSVKKVKIKFYCPELHKKQPIAKFKGDTVDTGTSTKRDAKRDHGLPATGIKVGTLPADKEQLGNLTDVLNVGEDMGATRRDLIIAIQTVTQESKARRSATNGQFVGLFQQSSRYGWPATRDPKKDAPAYFAKAIPYRKAHEEMTNGQIAQHIQGAFGSGPNATYDKDVDHWKDQATHTVDEFLGGDFAPIGTSTTESYPKSYQFDSDPDEKGENYLAATYRLAQEVNWRAFWVRDVLHFSDEERLFRSRSRMRLVRGRDGVESVSFNYPTHKKIGQMTVRVRMSKWFCPVGTVVTFGRFGVAGGNKPHEGGPARGRWLVNRIERNCFDDLATVTLTKPIRKKKEPAPEAGTKQVGDAAAIGGDTAQGTPKQIIDDVVLPLARRILKKPSLTPEAVEQANGAHSTNVAGTNRVSWHKGPPAQQWAADMSNGTHPTPQMDNLAKQLAELFKLQWNGSGAVSGQDPDGQYKYQMLYRTLIGGNHFNHVHFGVKLLKPLAQNRPVDTPETDPNRKSSTGRTPTQDYKNSGNQRRWNDKSFREHGSKHYDTVQDVPPEDRVAVFGWHDSHHTIAGGPYVKYPLGFS